jgi:ABC-type amino acid transport substrate-binding protein
VIQDPLIVAYETDADAIDALSAGDLDAVISSDACGRDALGPVREVDGRDLTPPA